MEKVTSKKDKDQKEDDLEDQRNKGHRGLNKKLKKSRKNEKETKKSKRQSKKDYADKRDKYREEYFAQGDKVKDKDAKDSKGIKIIKLRKALQKFLKIYEDDIQDVRGIFKSLDEGEEIEIQDIENPKIRKYLEKIFGYLKLRQKTGKLGFRKTDKTDFSLGTYMNALINDELLVVSEMNNAKKDRKHHHSAGESSSENKSDEEEEEEEDDDEKNMEKPYKKHKKNDHSESEEDNDVGGSNSDSQERHSQSSQAADKQKEQSSNEESVKPRILGPSLPPPKAQILPSLVQSEEKQNFIENGTAAGPSVLNKSEVGGWVVGGDLDSFLNDSFKEVESSKVKQFLTTRKVPEKRLKPAELDVSRMAQGSAPLEMESVIQNEDKMMESQQAYEDKYRSKTLMEIHQEQLAKKKEEQKGKPQERRPFDRNEDLQIKKTDSKKIFAALKDSFQQGPKFLPAQRK